MSSIANLIFRAATGRARDGALAVGSTVSISPIQQAQPDLYITTETAEAGKVPVTILHLCGVINYRTYLDFIAACKTVYDRGARRLLLDLAGVTDIGLAGLFALNSVARLFAGEALLDPEAGWTALVVAAHSSHIQAEMAERVKLLNPTPTVEMKIHQASFNRFFEVYHDRARALMTFDL